MAAFAANALTPPQQQLISEHLRRCQSCADNLQALHAGNRLEVYLHRRNEDVRFDVDEAVCRDLEERACAIAGEQITVICDGPVSPNEAVALPRDFGAYRLLQGIGNGSMGVVYKAEQQTIHRLVAVKVVRSGVFATAEERMRFQREGQAIARLRHDHVVQIHDFGEQDGQLFFVMELLEGGTLADKLQSEPLTPRSAAQLMRTLAQTMQSVHDRQIAHRDLKPSNVLFAADGTVKIADFGLAKLFDSGEDGTRTNVILGTPGYMAPEQANGEIRGVGPAADIYALGAIFYEILCGRPPFRAATPLQTIDLVRTSEAEPPSRHRAGVSPDLEAICLKCLEKEPSRRYASAASLADDLGCWLRGEPTQVRPPGRLGRAWRSIRRHPRLSAVVVLLVVLAFTAMLAAYHYDPKRPLRNLNARMEKNEAVVLIGPTGKPAWQEIITGNSSTRTTLDSGGVFTVQTWAEAFVELLADPHWQSYRMRAEVLHRKGDNAAGVGIYVGDRRFPTSKGTIHSLVYWRFNDLDAIEDPIVRLRKEGVWKRRQQPPKTNYIQLRRLVFLAAKADLTENFGGSSMSGPIAIMPGKWRRIALEVTPRCLRGFWEGKPVGELLLDLLARQGWESRDRYHKRHPNSAFVGLDIIPFTPQGGMGLFVEEGSAAFRNVVLEPLEGSD